MTWGSEKAVQLRNNLDLRIKSGVLTILVMIGTEDTQLTNHERRPEGPSKADDGAKLDVEKAVVKPSLVIASDLPGQVQLGTPNPHSLCFKVSLTMPAVLLAAIGRDAYAVPLFV